MSTAVLILGKSGTGKSTSIRTLPPEETFIINIIGKQLPFKGAKSRYKDFSNEDTAGNHYKSDDTSRILKAINFVNNKRPDIKYLVIDDFGYSISNSFMRKSLVKGYDKFSEMAKDAWEILKLTNELRNDLICFITMHCDIGEDGRTKPKTIGKMLDEKVCLEGMFTIVLHSLSNDGRYFFITNDDGHHMAKSPLEMFNTITIDNDLKLVADKINSYNDEDVQQ